MQNLYLTTAKHQKAFKTTKTKKVDDHRILPGVKKNPFMASSELINTLEKV